MTTPLLPPRGIFVPTSIIYSQTISPAMRDTWLQLRGLAWNNGETPAISVRQISELTGKSMPTIYGHMANLRDRGALRWRPAQTGTIIVTFDADVEFSKISELPVMVNSSVNQIDSKKLINNNNGDSKILENTGEFSKFSENSRKDSKKLENARDPLLDNDAVKLYRAVVHLSPNRTQRAAIAAAVKDVDAWRATLDHWLGHGWRPTNVSGMLDSYRTGGAAGCNLCKHGSNGRKPQTETLRDQLARLQKESET